MYFKIGVCFVCMWFLFNNYLNLWRMIGLIFKLKKCWFQSFGKENQRTICLVISQTLRIDGYHEIIGNKLTILWLIICFFQNFENNGYIPKLSLWIFENLSYES